MQILTKHKKKNMLLALNEAREEMEKNKKTTTQYENLTAGVWLSAGKDSWNST